MAWLSRFSLANRSLVALATIAILVLGAYIIPQLKQELYPSLEFPAVTVVTAYPGASPSVVESAVTTPLEQSILGTQGIQSVTSYSNQNASIIVVEYNFGTDTTSAAQQLQQKLTSVESSLPSGTTTPTISTFNLNDLPVISLAATSSEDQTALAVDLNSKVVSALSGISGVAQVNITGVQNQIVSITLDPSKLQADGITPSTISNVLAANNLTYPTGTVTNNGQTFAVSVTGKFSSVAELQNLVVGTMITGSTCTNAQKIALGAAAATQCQNTYAPVKLSDVATVQQTLAASSSLTRTNGQPSLGISITKTADGNTVAISSAVTAKLASLESQIGHNTKLTITSDQAPQVTSAVNGLVNEGLIGAGFAILIILLFLFSLRSTLVTAISIPLSVVIALIALWIGNLSLNLFTLGALTIAVGRVVDDSIVVLENIHRHLSMGQEKKVAIPTAVREVAGAVTASTLTTVAVFLPIAFTGGLVGEVFGPFGITVTVSLLASLLVALTIIPVLAYWFLKSPKVKAGAKPQDTHEKVTFLERGYVPVVRWVTGHRVISLIVAMALFLSSLTIISHLGTNFFSSSSTNTYTISETLPVGTSIDVTNTAAQKVETVLQGMEPTIKTYQMTIGGSGLASTFSGSSGSANTASFTITTDSSADQTAFQQQLQNRLNGLSNVGTLKLAASSGGFSSSGLAVNIQASDETSLATATQQVMDAVNKVPNVSNVSSSLSAAAPLIVVQVDPTKALLHGLTTAGRYSARSTPARRL